MSFEPGSVDNLQCKQCAGEVSLSEYQGTGLCGECFFERSCPPDWDKRFDEERKKWRLNPA